ncbi:hypothetical protein TNCV_3738651 [Trichonephila clavipes]|nr:hypothetical protein TNCV_3738651 [Trichonephila clavipes]
MSSPGIEPSPNGTAGSVSNHYRIGDTLIFLKHKDSIHVRQQLLEERLIRIDLLGSVKVNLGQTESM